MPRMRPDTPARNWKFARDLRRAPTKAETILWHFLRSRRLQTAKFRRQAPVGPFIVDFASVECRLVIELDGGQHAERKVVDAERTRTLEARGWRVVRYWNDEVTGQRDLVLEDVFLIVRGRLGVRRGG